MTHEPASQSYYYLWNSALKMAFTPTKCSLAVLSIAALTGGCNSGSDMTAETQVNQRAVDSPNSPAAMAGNSGIGHSPLVGAWMGKAVLNEQALMEAADSLPSSQRQALIHEARTFVTTEMAIQFSPSGEMETAIEMQPVGSQKVAGQTIGTWKVIETNDAEVTVETISTDHTGATQTSQTAFAVSVDGDRLVLQPQVSSALADCEALIYLDRQTIPAASVAQAPESSTYR